MSDWLISKRARATQIVRSDEQFVTHSFEMRNAAALCVAFVLSDLFTQEPTLWLLRGVGES